MAEIRKCTVAEIEQASNFKDLLGEYSKELVVDGAPPFSAKMDLYHQLEKNGSWQGFGAFLDGKLIGFVAVLVTILPHCGVIMAVTESLFVLRGYRKTGAGLGLIRKAEEYAQEKGSPCLLISAPTGGDLEKILPKLQYTQTNSVFFRSFKNV